MESRENAAAARRLELAREEAEAQVAQGRLEGERAGKRAAARVRAAAIRESRGSRLQAQQALVDELRAQAREAARRLCEGPGYDELLDRLSVTARNQLGPDAKMERDPPGLGGLRARAGTRSVDYTLPTLVERTIEELGEAVEALWR